MGDVKRQYRPCAADEPQRNEARPRPAPNNWEVKQRGNDFEVVRPKEERRAKEPRE
jgi:hypothetical protein